MLICEVDNGTLPPSSSSISPYARLQHNSSNPKWPRRSFGDIYQGFAESLCLLFASGEPLREGQPEVIVFSTISVTYVEQSVRNSGCCSSWCVERV